MTGASGCSRPPRRLSSGPRSHRPAGCYPSNTCSKGRGWGSGLVSAQPRIVRPLETPRTAATVGVSFPLPFGRRRSLLGPSCARRRSSASLTVGLPDHGPDLDGVATFRMRETRPGWVPPMPRGGGVPAAGQVPPAAACRFPAASPTPRYCHHHPGLTLTRRHRRFTLVHPSGLPLACDPGWHGTPWALTLSFAPRRHQRRTSRRGQALNTRPGLRHRHRRPPPNVSTHHMRPRVAPRGKCLPVRWPWSLSKARIFYRTGTFLISTPDSTPRS